MLFSVFLKDVGRKGKSKDKFAHVIFLTGHDAMKAYWGSEGIPPRII
jgi:hypothetical protein